MTACLLKVVGAHALPPLAEDGGGGADWSGELKGRDLLRATSPRRSGDQSRQPPEDEAQDILVRRGGGQMHLDLRLHLDDPRGDLDQSQAQGVELGDAPGGAFGHDVSQGPHQPVGPGSGDTPLNSPDISNVGYRQSVLIRSTTAMGAFQSTTVPLCWDSGAPVRRFAPPAGLS